MLRPRSSITIRMMTMMSTTVPMPIYMRTGYPSAPRPNLPPMHIAGAVFVAVAVLYLILWLF